MRCQKCPRFYLTHISTQKSACSSSRACSEPVLDDFSRGTPIHSEVQKKCSPTSPELFVRPSMSFTTHPPPYPRPTYLSGCSFDTDPLTPLRAVRTKCPPAVERTVEECQFSCDSADFVSDTKTAKRGFPRDFHGEPRTGPSPCL